MEENYRKYLKKGSAFLVAPALFGSVLPGNNASAELTFEDVKEFFGKVFSMEWIYALARRIFSKNKTLEEGINWRAENGSSIDTFGKKIDVLDRGVFSYEIRYMGVNRDIPYIFINKSGECVNYIVAPGYKNFIFKYKGTDSSGYCEDLKILDLKNQKIFSLGGFYTPESVVSFGLRGGYDQIKDWQSVNQQECAEMESIGVCLKLIERHENGFWKTLFFPQSYNKSDMNIVNNNNNNNNNNFNIYNVPQQQGISEKCRLAEDIEVYAQKSTAIDSSNKSISIASRCFIYDSCHFSDSTSYLSIHDENTAKGTGYIVFPGNGVVFRFKERNDRGFYKGLEMLDLKSQRIVGLGDNYKSQNIIKLAFDESLRNTIRGWQFVDSVKDKSCYEDLRNIGVCVKVIEENDKNIWLSCQLQGLAGNQGYNNMVMPPVNQMNNGNFSMFNGPQQYNMQQKNFYNVPNSQQVLGYNN